MLRWPPAWDTDGLPRETENQALAPKSRQRAYHRSGDFLSPWGISGRCECVSQARPGPRCWFQGILDVFSCPQGRWLLCKGWHFLCLDRDRVLPPRSGGYDDTSMDYRPRSGSAAIGVSGIASGWQPGMESTGLPHGNGDDGGQPDGVPMRSARFRPKAWDTETHQGIRCIFRTRCQPICVS